MREFRHPQGSPEWLQSRCGVVTASMFKVARERLKSGPNKGDFTEAAKDYAFKVAYERISGELMDEGYQTWQMERGHELEPAARYTHEIETGCVVEQVGFITDDDGVFGASADGFIGSDTGLEIKCLVSAKGIRKLWFAEDMSDFMDQVQGGMWITGRISWHFALYCPPLAAVGKELFLRVVERDQVYIEAMEKDLREFAALVDRYEAELRAAPKVAA
ncbi:lambda exonuclease family protein [Stenotrophomonas rhizophila]